jgi:hypothetical protein
MIKPLSKSSSAFTAVFLVAAVGLTGCAQTPGNTDLQFGNASKRAFMGQVSVQKNPNSGQTLHPTDSVAMKSSIDRYHRSFETLPAPVNIFNIGVGSAASTPTR